MRTRSILVVLALLLATGAWAEPVAPSSAESYTQAGAFKVSRPNDQWSLSPESDNSGVSLERRDAGLGIILQWVPNRASMNPKRLAHLLEAQLIARKDSTGKRFGVSHATTLGGQPAETFTVEYNTADKMLHKAQYTVVARGKNSLVVAVVGEDKLIEKHQPEIDFVLKSIAFEGVPTPASASK
jgi:hypothetical protein